MTFKVIGTFWAMMFLIVASFQCLQASGQRTPASAASTTPQPTEKHEQFAVNWAEVVLAVFVLVVGGLGAYFLKRSQKRETAPKL